MVPQKVGFWGRWSPGRPWLVHAYCVQPYSDRHSAGIWLRSGLHAKDPPPCVARGCSNVPLKRKYRILNRATAGASVQGAL
ncbi:hypothetical protein FOCG_02684 [Fusarium oxysporum f. sp. radicis-lycopersici 26381]|uniref:Uncharacterized protein n=1 Tax=Fusarium oxysporum Fo47 TaxID=660027 RepID=W9KCK9_FUSOX|nr:hypothetical protein FOZG_07159 [Fusarium oxysporum Fo47]EXA00775.1 hypothetical protein FOWG_00884 [Fusarium oxysporum f. sp. lycopersici MN25]EXL59461.1 hypothetical protein FOCG_02684 [Fusarium oxysporum f. sp. radicis-lycopersici 26381]